MAEFSGNVVEAYYVNEDYSLIEIIYTDPNGERIKYITEADENSADYKAFLLKVMT